MGDTMHHVDEEITERRLIPRFSDGKHRKQGPPDRRGMAAELVRLFRDPLRVPLLCEHMVAQPCHHALGVFGRRLPEIEQ